LNISKTVGDTYVAILQHFVGKRLELPESCEALSLTSRRQLLILVHLILRMSPHHSHHFRYHHLSLPLPFTPDLKLISFTNPFLHIVTLIPSGVTSRILTELKYWIKGALLCLF